MVYIEKSLGFRYIPAEKSMRNIKILIRRTFDQIKTFSIQETGYRFRSAVFPGGLMWINHENSSVASCMSWAMAIF
jgi:hypothetical protein